MNALLADELSPVLPKHICVITRDPEGFAASGLAARGINLVAGLLGNPDPIFEHLQIHGVQFGQTAAILAQAPWLN